MSAKTNELSTDQILLAKQTLEAECGTYGRIFKNWNFDMILMT